MLCVLAYKFPKCWLPILIILCGAIVSFIYGMLQGQYWAITISIFHMTIGICITLIISATALYLKK